MPRLVPPLPATHVPHPRGGRCHGQRRPPRGRRGFTLIELMVALTGGLMFSAFVFMLAKDTTRFYQNELRLSTATQNAVTGFQRLRTDIARAGFLSTPNLSRDPSTCVNLMSDAGFTGNQGLQRLATLSINTNGGDNQHSIDLMGSYASADTFPIRTVMAGGGGTQVYLQPQSGPMVRLVGQIVTPSQTQLNAALTNVFLPGRVLRIVDKAGAQQFGIITGVDTTNVAQPFIQLSNAPAIRMKSSSAQPCGLRGTEAGSLVNVVQRIRYSLQTLTDTDPDFGPLFNGAAADGVRQDLVRTELDWSDAGAPLDGTTRELVAEYAVGLHFRLTAADPAENYRIAPVVAAEFANFAGSPLTAPANAGPHRIRSVRALLAVRSSAPDRGADLLPDAEGPVADGIYRVNINAAAPDDGTPAPAPRFARVRTLQADIALRNQRNARW